MNNYISVDNKNIRLPIKRGRLNFCDPGKLFIHLNKKLYNVKHYPNSRRYFELSAFFRALKNEYNLNRNDAFHIKEKAKKDDIFQIDYASREHYLFESDIEKNETIYYPSYEAFEGYFDPLYSSYRFLFLLHQDLFLDVTDIGFFVYYDSGKYDEEYFDTKMKRLHHKSLFQKKDRHMMFSIIQPQDSFFVLQNVRIKSFDINIEKYYNNDIQEFDRDVKQFLDQRNRSGIALLYGEPGTGKTYYIRHLIASQNHRFIFMPVNIVSLLMNPDFLRVFKNYRNAVLIIEDSEQLFYNKEAAYSLLNISDGLFSDSYGLKLLATFNTCLNKIDPAFKRKGRLVVSYEFRKLSAEKASYLTGRESEPCTLAEALNTND